jgi:xanthine dehydrogenase accessory factor
MSELLGVLQAMVAEAEAGRASAFCVVVRTQGSAPQRPGAAMLVRADGTTVGTLGGGCVEAEAQRKAAELLRVEQSARLHLQLDFDYGWDDMAICGGQMDVAVMPVTRQTDLSPFRQAITAADRCRPASVPIVITHEGKRLQYDVHVEVPPTLLIAGAGHVGLAVAELALELDFHVVVIDDRSEYASLKRFGPNVKLIVDDFVHALQSYPVDASCYVVIVTRGHKHDEAALEAVIRSPAGYIGMIGSKRKVAAVFEHLREAGAEQELIEKVHSPIGLAIGAVTVNEIAVSIMAELVQVRRRTTPKLVTGPIELDA